MQQGLDLMLYGMGTVFVFLCCLIAVTVVMSRVAQHWPDDVPESAPSIALDSNTAAVIKRAVIQHRERLKLSP
ncbi:MAG: OadG family protein [Proteobacteria bacterium]|nr:OadG family protein [Pseudomonadota bacterium]